LYASPLPKIYTLSLHDALPILSGGNINQITDLFKGDTSVNSLTSNPMVSGMISNLISKLTGNLGMDSGVSKGFATAAIPKILSSDRKSTRLNSSHVSISYAVFC